MNSDSELEVDVLEEDEECSEDHCEIEVEDKIQLPTRDEISLFDFPTLGKRPAIQSQLGPDSNEPNVKRLRTTIDLSIPDVNFNNFRGYPQVLKDVSELVIHIKEGNIYKALGVTPPRGFLLYGPPGSGKTLLAKAIAGELEVPLLSISGSDLMPCMFGMYDYKIKQIFHSAHEKAPCIIFFDKVEVVAQRKETANKMERKVSEQLLACLDGLSNAESNIMVIGATTTPEFVDPAFRMAGRFDREIRIEIPDKKARKEILHFLTSQMKLQADISLDEIAEVTPGFVGADLKSLITEAAVAAVTRKLRIKIKEKNENEYGEEEENYLPFLKTDEPILTNDEMENFVIQKGDFLRALKSVQPSTKREGFIAVPNVSWEDVGSLQEIRSHMQKSILLPVKHPEEFLKLGITRPSGILLCGPPGCGKTLVAKAIANEADINFISVKGPELLSMYVGESEKAVRQCFQRAKNAQPCIIFFDEVDSLCPKRVEVCEGNNIIARVLNQILTEMDGIEERKGVFLLAATNRPDILDPAVLRPGRFDKVLFIGLPSAAGRAEILRAITKNGSKPPMPDVDLDAISKDPLLDGYTGADLASLIKEASVQALTEFMDGKMSQLKVTPQIILDVAGRLRPSVSSKDLEFYKKLKATFSDRNEVL